MQKQLYLCFRTLICVCCLSIKSHKKFWENFFVPSVAVRLPTGSTPTCPLLCSREGEAVAHYFTTVAFALENQSAINHTAAGEPAQKNIFCRVKGREGDILHLIS